MPPRTKLSSEKCRLYPACPRGPGPLVLSQEGGYAPMCVPFCGVAVMEELSGVKAPIDEPMAAWAASAGGQKLQPRQDEIIRRAERLASLR